ncbi:MAG: alanine--tRNA ligase [Candidatus Zixiibacteriota bacterium]
MKTSEIRQSFVEYFLGKDHRKYSSSPVIPFDDPTLMFANAGMNQFKDIFTGKKKAEFPRVVTVQKCMRAGGKHNDLENVGRTGRHHTFFEMLGNFSFGDYFKEEAIYYHWEWVTKYLKLPKDRLYATVYLDDDEAFGLWEKIAPELKNGRILRFGKEDNFWTMGETGPNGPCSEIHFDRGEKYGVGPQHQVNGDTERYVEIGNLVFMQYNTRPDGITEPLPRPSVDTGSGLERIACMMQKADSNYETDAFTGLIEHISEITGKKYHTDDRGVSHRVIADHIRALTFCIADGGGLSNEKQGYVLRRILRRASRHGRLLDKHEPFIYRLVPALVEQMGGVYPEIAEKQNHIEKVIRAEEESFGRTLDTGLELFESLAKKIKAGGGKTIPGAEVFKLYDTYGFPVDMTGIMADEQGLEIDMAGFDKMMLTQKEQSRTASAFGENRKEQLQFMLGEILGQIPADRLKTEFVREEFELDANVLEIFELNEGGHKILAVVPDRTPFYIDAGGQISDYGTIESKSFTLKIDYLYKYNDAIVHFGELIEKKYDDLENIGELKVQLKLDSRRRWDIMRNHTATHLLHAALRKVLGDHVKQSGSYVGPDKLRFDFSHFNPMTTEQIKRVEEIVNGKILEGHAVGTIEDDLEKAKKSGAMAIFGEKYGSKVRVVSVSDFSKELCGGTHVQNVSQIGPFMITLETAVASGIRRIEAVTGREAVSYMLRQKETVDKISKMTNRPIEELSDAVGETQKKLLELQKENKKLKSEKFSGGSVSVGLEEKINGISFRHHDFDRVEAEEMAGWIDSGKDANYPLITIAVGMVNGKRTFMSSASSTAKVHVGNLSRDILKELGGRGGGKPNFAQGSIPEDMDSNHVFKTAAVKIRETIEKSTG